MAKIEVIPPKRKITEPRYPMAEQLEELFPKTVRQGLSQSMNEELTAVSWYRARAKHARSQGDEATARFYEKIASEEDEHYREFNQHLLARERFGFSVGRNDERNKVRR